MSGLDGSVVGSDELNEYDQLAQSIPLKVESVPESDVAVASIPCSCCTENVGGSAKYSPGCAGSGLLVEYENVSPDHALTENGVVVIWVVA